MISPSLFKAIAAISLLIIALIGEKVAALTVSFCLLPPLSVPFWVLFLSVKVLMWPCTRAGACGPLVLVRYGSGGVPGQRSLAFILGNMLSAGGASSS